MSEKEQREEFERIVRLKADEIVHGPGRRDIDWNDTLQSVATRLEAFADEFECLAETPEQKALAGKFNGFVWNFVGKRLSMESLGVLAAELEEFDLDQIDVALAGELIELGESAGQAWQKWMDDQPIYAVEQVKDGRWVVWNTRDMEPEDIFNSESAARGYAKELHDKAQEAQEIKQGMKM